MEHAPLHNGDQYERDGAIARLGLWSAGRPRVVIAAWVALVILAVGVSGAIGTRFSNTVTLPHTDSQKALALLEAGAKKQAGDSDQIVFATDQGTLLDARTHASIDRMLARLRHISHVVGVSSPYSGNPADGELSKSRRIGFATVDFDQDGTAVPRSTIEKVVNTAKQISSAHLQVQLGGNAIEQLNRPNVGPATMVGVLAAMVILLLTFGSFTAMVIPIATALAGIAMSTGAIALFSHVFVVPDFAQQIAMMMGLGVGVDYALLIVMRYREAYRATAGDVERSVAIAARTAGRSVTFAAATVVIALSGLYAVGIDLLNGVALAATAAVILVLAGSLTLLPAILSLAGARVGLGRSKRVAKSRSRWVAFLTRSPGVATVVSLACLGALVAPVLGLHLAISGASTDQPSTTTRQAYELLERGFGPGFNGPLVVAVQLPRTTGDRTLGVLRSRLAETAGVASVGEPVIARASRVASLVVIPTSAPQAPATAGLVGRIRKTVLPRALAGSGATAYVGGYTARTVDFTSRLSAKLPIFIALVIGLSALLLLVVFRSLLIPVQAALMNLLSVGASLGVLQAVFERGWLGGILGIQRSPIEPYLPVILFAIIFGLSMDYEVFLVSRIQESWRESGNARLAVASGLDRTSRVITAAAAVMIVVFASFATGGNHVLELFGIGLATAILLDAVVVRLLLLPAVLIFAGNATWRIPSWLDRLIPNVQAEAGSDGELGNMTPALDLD